MERSRIPKPGEIYNHFKDKPYQIITVATHTETNESMVVYQAMYGNFKTYVRPLEMFVSEVDRVKYPEVKQKYRFELRTLQEDEDSSDELVSDSNSMISPQISSSNIQSSIEIVTLQSDDQPAEPKKHEELLVNSADGVNLILLKFLDAESYTKKLEVLTVNRKHMTDRIINDMAVALDCAVDEGPLDTRIQELINCLEALRRFEDRRLR